MDALRLDLRYAVRNLLRRPGFSALVILTLAIGVGVNTVAFSAINALLFHPFTFSAVDRLGWLMLAAPGNSDAGFSWPEIETLRRSTRAFDAVAVKGQLPVALDVEGHAEQLFSLFVSADYFRAIDARAERGRVLQTADRRGGQIAGVVSHRFWQRRLGGGAFVSRTLTINDRAVTIVGVMPDAFQGPDGLYAPDIWLPLEHLPALVTSDRLTDPANRWLSAFARLAPGASVAQAQAELAAVATDFQKSSPAGGRAMDRGSTMRDGHLTIRFYPMRDGHPEVQSLARYAWVALSIVAVVLLIACFNVAALLLARAAERQREIGIRTALGATRARIVRQLLTEGLLLGCASGLAALVVAEWSERLLSVFSLPAPIPQRLHMVLDGRLVSFTSALVLIAGTLPAIVAALEATRRNLTPSMRLDAGWAGLRRSALRSAFVMAQVAGSTLFLALALLLVRSFLAASAFDPGFDEDRAVVATLDPASFGYEPARTHAMLRDVLARLERSPAIAFVSAADRVPFSVGYPRWESVLAPGDTCAPGACRPILAFAVLPGHFEAMGIPIRAGHDMTEAEAAAGTGVVISEALAKAHWPSAAAAVGQPLRLGTDRRAVEVVGVAADIHHFNIAGTPEPVVYRALTEADLAAGFTIVARASTDPRAAMLAIRDAVHAAAPGVPLASVERMAERMALPLWPYRTAAGFFLVCGTLALLLAAIGLFGVTYFAVRQRTREFGIRIAIGASGGAVVRQVLGEGLRLSVPGAALGFGGALIGGRLLARLLVGVGPADPASFAAAAAIDALIVLLACAVPARRATRADPMAALRSE